MADEPRIRSLKIRRPPPGASTGDISMEAVSAMIERRVADAVEPLKAQIVALQSNAINLKVIFGDLHSTAIIAASDNSSTKARLNALAENLASALSNVDTLIGLNAQQTEVREVPMFDLQQALSEAAADLGIRQGHDDDDGDIYDEPGDDLVANVSEEVEDMPRGRGNRLTRRTRRRIRE